MRIFGVDNLCVWRYFIDRYQREMDKPRGALVSRKTAKGIFEHFQRDYVRFCEEAQWPEARDRLGNLLNILSNGHLGLPLFRGKLPTAERIKTELGELDMAIVMELEARQFVVVEKDKWNFLEAINLFGEAVIAAFPSAAEDIRAAGHCIALDLNTAAVFHLMRTAEIGLRTLAKKLGVKLRYPLEFAEWGTVIDACNDKLTELKPTTRGKKKAAQLELYANAVSECRAFKETWRDCVMHARRSGFSSKEAETVFERVRAFMRRLAPAMSLK